MTIGGGGGGGWQRCTIYTPTFDPGQMWVNVAYMCGNETGSEHILAIPPRVRVRVRVRVGVGVCVCVCWNSVPTAVCV